MSLRSIEVTVSGWVAANPEIRGGKDRAPVTIFRMMHTPRMRGSDGQWSDGRSSAFTVKAWGKLAENVQACVRVGNPVIVTGRLEVPVWKHPEKNITQKEVQIVASSVGFDLATCRSTCWRETKGEDIFNNRLTLEAWGSVDNPIVAYGDKNGNNKPVPSSVKPSRVSIQHYVEQAQKAAENLLNKPRNTRDESAQSSHLHRPTGGPPVTFVRQEQSQPTVLATPSASTLVAHSDNTTEEDIDNVMVSEHSYTDGATALTA
ncbi:MAG: single-stranded DNA-binding protein [Actinomycetaceae bacterium]|nr:single-stranded DNA-binding protein [Actinomycetaceae bacterium]